MKWNLVTYCSYLSPTSGSEFFDTFTYIFLLRIFPIQNIYSWKLLRKLKWQIPREPLAARYNRCHDPLPCRGPTVEKHWPRVQIKKPPIIQYFPATCYFHTLGSNIFLWILLSNGITLCCSLNARDQSSEPYKTTRTYIIIYYSVFIFLHSGVEQIDQRTIPVAAQSKMWVCDRSLAEITGSDLAGGMNIFFLWVLCVVR